MVILKGAEVSAKIKEQAEKDLRIIKEKTGKTPKLAIVRIGEKPDDLSYERGAKKKLESFGLETEVYPFPEEISHQEFKAEFEKINEDCNITGILLLKPLPKQINEKEIDSIIDPSKDMDGISPVNIAKIFAGEESGYAPCTAEAVIETLKANQIPISGKRTVIVGRSMIVGKPLSMLLLKENATVTICHTKTVNLKETCQEAEILVAAAGRGKMLNQDYVGSGAVVIDVGINVDENGRLCEED